MFFRLFLFHRNIALQYSCETKALRAMDAQLRARNTAKCPVEKLCFQNFVRENVRSILLFWLLPKFHVDFTFLSYPSHFNVLKYQNKQKMLNGRKEVLFWEFL